MRDFEPTGTDEYLATAAPPGSALYYAGLLSTSHYRRELLAWHALEHELLKSVMAIEDPGVARIRLDWWREEIERAGTDQARHPLVRMLQPALRAQRLPAAIAANAIDALQAGLGLPDRDQAATLEHDYRQYYGPLWQCAARLAGIDAEPALAAASVLGGLHHEQRALLALPRTLARGQHRPLAAEALTRAAVSIDQPLTAPAWRGLLAQQFRQLQQRLEQASRDFPATHAAAFLHGLILARLDAALAAEIARDGGHIGSHGYALTPIRRLWLAWRCRRQVLKHHPN